MLRDTNTFWLQKVEYWSMLVKQSMQIKTFITLSQCFYLKYQFKYIVIYVHPLDHCKSRWLYTSRKF